MTPLQLYLILKLDTFIYAFIMLFIFSITTGLIGLLIWFTEEEKLALKISIISFIMSLFFGLISVILPSTKQMATLLVFPKIINNEQVQGLPQKLLNVIDVELNKILDEK